MKKNKMLALSLAGTLVAIYFLIRKNDFEGAWVSGGGVSATIFKSTMKYGNDVSPVSVNGNVITSGGWRGTLSSDKRTITWAKPDGTTGGAWYRRV